MKRAPTSSPLPTTPKGSRIQPDGRAVISGGSRSKGSDKLLVGRFTPDPEPVKVSLIATQGALRGQETRRSSAPPSAEKLKGTKKADVIAGLGGNDRISALAGNDIVCGGKGKDMIDRGKGKDELLGEEGEDTLKGGNGKDKLLGGPGQDLCNGGDGKDAKAGGCETR